MSMLRPRAVALAVAASVWCGGTLQAQSPQAGGHVHYAEPAAQQVSPTGALAPRLQNLGPHTFPVSTRNRQAQQFMSQGLNLAYAFNHAEARRAFREAARLDPNLAMALHMYIHLMEGTLFAQSGGSRGAGRSPGRQSRLHRTVRVPLPPRHALGAILLEAGRPAEAETVYWEDLRRNRENGWALFGLLQALRAQQKMDEAALIEARFSKAWARADITLTASRFGRSSSPSQTR